MNFKRLLIVIVMRAFFMIAIFRWVSVGSDLKYDARRDLDDVGAKCVQGVESFYLESQFSLLQCDLYCTFNSMWFTHKIYLETLELVCYSVQEITLLINKGLILKVSLIFFFNSWVLGSP